MVDSATRPVLRTLARLVASSGAILLLAIAVMLWSRSDGGRADASAPTPPAPATRQPVAAPDDPALLPEADDFALLEAPAPARPQTREEKRFARVDRNDDGAISQAEFLANRRRNFDRLDTNGDGVLAFEEYAAQAIRTFAGVDRNGDGRLNPAEFAATARPPKTQSAAAQAKSDCVCS